MSLAKPLDYISFSHRLNPNNPVFLSELPLFPLHIFLSKVPQYAGTASRLPIDYIDRSIYCCVLTRTSQCCKAPAAPFLKFFYAPYTCCALELSPVYRSDYQFETCTVCHTRVTHDSIVFVDYAPVSYYYNHRHPNLIADPYLEPLPAFWLPPGDHTSPKVSVFQNVNNATTELLSIDEVGGVHCCTSCHFEFALMLTQYWPFIKLD